MMKMKADRPLLIDGEAKTEFETTQHHGKELIAAGLAVQVDPEEVEAHSDTKMAGEVENKMADAPANNRVKKAD